MISFAKASLAQTWTRVRQGFAHAFSTTIETEVFTTEDLALLERVADAVVNGKMAAPATVFLESLGPMNFLGSQALHFFTPIIEIAFNAQDVSQIAHLLERRETIPRLLALIETRTALKGAAAQ
ncbi:MAG TPA: hypothetical protein VEI50_06030 [Nitrospiraceae bacterium]|nr:hypothetical protein [Nitrospiraceae bacterium]